MKTQYIPAAIERTGNGQDYARIAPMSFPVNAEGYSVLIHRPTCYNKSALWNQVKTWFSGGTVANSAFQVSGSYNQSFENSGWSDWKIIPYSDIRAEVLISWDSFAKPYLADSYTFGYQWNPQLTTLSEKTGHRKVTIPPYYSRSPEMFGMLPAF